MTDFSENTFFDILKKHEHELIKMGYRPDSFSQNGSIFTAFYTGDYCNVKFLYGSPEFHAEMILYTPLRKFELKDLIVIPDILAWWKEHNKANGNKLNSEISFFINLLNFSLPYIRY